MADPIRGKLVWQGTTDKRIRRVIYPTRKGMSQPTPFDPEQLDASLRGSTDEEIEVDLEVQGGKPIRIRPVGEQFVAGAKPQLSRPAERHNRPGSGRQQGRDDGQHGPRQQAQRVERQQDRQGSFHNPYNFVPALPRSTDHPELGDREPIGHHRYHSERISGVIQVTMTLATPLLLPDAARAQDCLNDHKTFPVRVDAEGRPYVPPTSLKGMLRSAFEAVTNSRLAVFAEHDDRLAFRMDARCGIQLIPARVSNGEFTLLTGTTPVGKQGEPGFCLHAAWLPRYAPNGSIAPWAVKYNNGLPQHGDEVTVWIEEYQHWRWDRKQQVHRPDFKYWKVRSICEGSQSLLPKPASSQAREKRDRQPWHEPKGVLKQVGGWVCVTNANINRKHDERVFFMDGPAQMLPCDQTHERMWRELIENYQLIHEDDLRFRRSLHKNPWDYLGREPGRTAWSRHVYTREDRNLVDGMLCYVRLNTSGNAVEAVFPVMIARELFQTSPRDLLPSSLLPATSILQLSPADRVFGWSNQTGNGAYRGNFRVGPVSCESPDPIERFPDLGLPLAILGQPKPQQGRFYLARSTDGEAQQDGLTKPGAGYTKGKGLRGRKVYPHHRNLPSGFWDDPMTDRTQHAQEGHFQEYRRPQLNGLDRDNQNRSVQGWVKPATVFVFDLHVTNLSQVELGALIWLLSLPPEHCHRLGGGKPLGFGSVRLAVDEARTHLHDGNGWKQIYSTLNECMPPQADRSAAITAFKDAVVNAYGKGRSFEEVPFIAAFLGMAKGFLQIHYPRARQRDQQGNPIPGPVPPHPEGRAYEWFVANDRMEHGQVVEGLALRDLVGLDGTPDPGLPILDAPHQGR